MLSVVVVCSGIKFLQNLMIQYVYWFFKGMVSMVFSGHINVMVFTGAATGVVRIQTSGAIWVDRLVAEALHICNDHFEVISTELFAYNAAIQDGGFANGRKV